MANTIPQNAPEMMGIHEILRKLAVTSEVGEPDRETALDILLSEQSIMFDKFLERIRAFFYETLLDSDLDSYEIKQAVLDQYANVLKMQNRPVNIGTENEPVFVTMSLLEEIHQVLKMNTGKVQAIKMIRDHFGFGVMGIVKAQEILKQYMSVNNIGHFTE